MIIAPIDMIKSRTSVGREKDSGHTTYATHRKNDLEKIKNILQWDSTPQIYFGKGWVRINGISFNGIRKEHIEQIIKENNIKNSIAILQ